MKKPANYFAEHGASNQHGGELFAFDEAITGWLFSR